MKSAVNSTLVTFLLLLAGTSLSQSSSQSSCECVQCPADEIAVCRYDTGSCRGKCVRIKGGFTSKDFSAEFLSDLLGSKVTSDNLNESPRAYYELLDAVLKSKGEPVEVKFNDKSMKIGVGLKGDAAKALSTTRRDLRNQSLTRER